MSLYRKHTSWRICFDFNERVYLHINPYFQLLQEDPFDMKASEYTNSISDPNLDFFQTDPFTGSKFNF